MKAWEGTFDQLKIKYAFENGRKGLKRTKKIFDKKVNEERGIVYAGEGNMSTDKTNVKCPSAS